MSQAVSLIRICAIADGPTAAEGRQRTKETEAGPLHSDICWRRCRGIRAYLGMGVVSSVYFGELEDV